MLSVDLGGAVLNLNGNSGLAGAATKVIKAGLHNLGLALNLDFVDVGGVYREHALDTLGLDWRQPDG